MGKLTELSSDFSFKVYPNPASDKVSIEASSLEGIKEFKIMSIEGKELLRSELNGSIDVSVLSKGLYTVSILGQDGVILGTEKLVID
ncbi:MAG: hypothetical protein COA32_16965 [Fluviicola sp.]|nr:MAG: hypothetical protein COA32_16965 [Fluviicola sp.]